MDQSQSAFLFDFDLQAAVTHSIVEGFESAYFVWWNQDIGWYNLDVQDDWVSAYDSGRISVYKIV